MLLGIAACGAFAFVRGVSAARRGDAVEVARYLGWLAVGVMSALVTPYGTGILGYYPSLLGNPNLRYIGEWQHASLGGPSIPFLVLLVGTASYVAFAWRRGARPDPFLACLAAALTLMGFQAIRYQVWFALIAALLVSDLSTRARRRPVPTTPASRFLPRFAAAVACLGALAAATITATTPAKVFEGETPPAALRATAQAAQTTHGAILTDDLTGSALPWLYPQLAGRVAFDSRTEIFPAKPFEQLVRFLTLSPHWQATLHGYNEISVTCLMGHPKLCQTIPRAARMASRLRDGLGSCFRSAVGPDGADFARGAGCCCRPLDQRDQLAQQVRDRRGEHRERGDDADRDHGQNDRVLRHGLPAFLGSRCLWVVHGLVSSKPALETATRDKD